MDVIVTLSATGGLLGGTAAWVGIFSPKARELRRARAIRSQREHEVHQALFGLPARHDDSGALIAPAQPGLVADVRALASLPILNGKGTAALGQIDKLTEHMADLDGTVRRLDRRTQTFGRRLARIDREFCRDEQ